jgi:hypothetical protein
MLKFLMKLVLFCGFVLTCFDVVYNEAVVFCVQIRVDIQVVVLDIEGVIEVVTGLRDYSEL